MKGKIGNESVNTNSCILLGIYNMCWLHFVKTRSSSKMLYHMSLTCEYRWNQMCLTLSP